MTDVIAPCAGTVIALAQVPDEVFAAEMVGPGLAVDPVREPSTVVSPVTGRVVKLYPHAFVVLGDDGTGLLVHLGINTVQLKGEGFEVLVAEGDVVEAGAPMVRWDPAAIEAAGRSPVVPLCVMDAPAGAVSSPRLGEVVTAGEVLFTWPG